MAVMFILENRSATYCLFEMKKVFISYSHDSTEHAARVLDFSNRLIHRGGIDCFLDQYNPNPEEGWPRWMEKHIRQADFVLVVCTETYLRRILNEEKLGIGLGATWEGNLIYNHFYEGKTISAVFIPVLFEDGQKEHIPSPFIGKTNYRVDTDQGFELLYRELTSQPLNIKPTPKPEITPLPPKNDGSASVPSPTLRPEYISLHRLPDTSGLLFGRDTQLALLYKAWEDGNTHVVAFVAQGGEGKTALVRRWVNEMEKEGFRGAKRVYAWSFYSQGTAADRNVSGDPFLADALTWFGDAAMANSPASSTNKALRLAALVRSQRTLLLLDGVEPLQYPLSEPHNGRIRDEGLKVLLKELAASNPGLCVVSTRIWIRELDSFSKDTVQQDHLPHLDKHAGADLLAGLGVKGPRKELEKAAEDYRGHALALTLLGNLLRGYYRGKITQRDLIPPLQDEDDWGGHARKVLEYYNHLLEGKPELDILYIMGLFDRPAEAEVIQVLRTKPAIPDLTAHLIGLSEHTWKKALKHLRDLSLIEDAEGLDCHPLIREHFAQRLCQQYPIAWQEAHRRLYEHNIGLAEEFPDTVEKMEPLYWAMGHACKAGLYQTALHEVYWKRIEWGGVGHSWKKLGSFSTNLAAIVGLFVRPWREVHRELTENDHSYLLNEAGICLRALGRLREAIAPMEVGLQMVILKEGWKNASITASNLSELRLSIGEINHAVMDGRSAVDYAEKSEDLFERITNRATLADALQQSGAMDQAEVFFCEAEEIQLEIQPLLPHLYSLRGYKYCELLLGRGDWAAVKKRASETLTLAEEHLSLLDVALDQLSLGRAIHREILAASTDDFSAAISYLDQAVEGLKKAAQLQYVPSGLLARAALHRDMQAYDQAQADLAAVLEIADPEMRLHLTDYHLESARLCLARGGALADAQVHVAKAERLIRETGYHRRDGELADLQRQVS